MYKVGDKVVYPHHGAGTVVKKESRTILGQEREYLTIKILHNDMTVNVPTENADRVGLRKVIDEEMVERVLKVLHGNGTKMPKNWNRRFKYNRDKMKTGDIFELAEVVRNLSLRDQEKGLSTGEKQMFVKAKKILASELMYAKGMDEDEAAVWLDEELDSVGVTVPRPSSRRCTPTAAPQASCASAQRAPPPLRLSPAWSPAAPVTAASRRARPPPASSFKETVVAELKTGRPRSRARDRPERVRVRRPEPGRPGARRGFAEYEADPDRRDEIVAGLVDEAERRLDAGIGELSLEEVSAGPDAAPQGPVRRSAARLRAGEDAACQATSSSSTSSTPRTISPSFGRRTSSGGARRSRRFTTWPSTTSCGRRTRKSRSSASRPAIRSSAAGRPPDGYDATRMVVPGLRRQIVREYGGSGRVRGSHGQRLRRAPPRAPRPR